MVTSKQPARIQTARLEQARTRAAVAWAKEIAALAEKKSDVQTVAVYVDAFGETGTIRWLIDFADWGQLEKVNAQLMSDTDYRAKLAQAGAVLMEGPTNDVLMRAV